MGRNGIKALLCMFLIVVLVQSGQTAYAKSREDGKVTGCQIRVPVSTKMYKTSKSKKKIKTIAKGTVLKVLKYKNHRFYVKYKKKKGWISEKHVFINLVDYIPSIEYKLHLAQKENLFNIRGKTIKGVSNRLFYTSKGLKSRKQCWLNYIAAKKLLKAQKSLQKDGYSIVLYDAYRPRRVSETLYNMISHSELADDMGGAVENYIALRSAHNKGVAVDITLKSLKTGKELQMPSDIMTLGLESSEQSWYYKTTQAGKNARMLREYMTDAGFVYLPSEWWHFQDGNRYKGTFTKEAYYNISQ